ncbi:probable receptor-like protein kinase At1g80640 [Helianthus annuus]|uniref:probable receptor-like protein kinase At1g80640 n=1 Tax=Helianthus annuus TaxID=4232 RepID=UPI001652B8F7|nr:probable receptor-like protein kinase At1g80640 [Helianthus annuus]
MVLTEESSLEPLRYTVRQVVKPEDQVVVLVFFNSGDLQQSPVMSSCCIVTDGRKHQPSERERYIAILREEISQRTKNYMRIFRPFYKECKNMRVKFMVKIVFGSAIDAIISEERNNTGATSVLIGRSFAMQHAQWANQRSCRSSSERDDAEIIVCNCKPSRDVPESSRAQIAANLTKKMSKIKKKPLSHDEQKPIYCTLPNFEGIYGPSSSSPSVESTNDSEGVENIKDQITSTSFHENGFLVELSWEDISEITERFKDIIQFDSRECFQMFRGRLEDRSLVFVKRYIGTECRYVLEAEKKAALTMSHKNVLGLYGYHMNENAMALVFSCTSRAGGALLNRFLNGSWKELENLFENKMKIAIGIAQGLRYMHEQYPQGLVVHRDLRPCSVLLGNNLVPQITGFGHAKWLTLDKSSLTRNSCGHMHPSDPSSLALIKSDILAFGILLLRLFCKRSAPRDDNSFVTWARCLLAQRAYHMLYDESEYDVHGLLVVTSVAARCISTRPNSRPCMSKVLSCLKGELSCAEQTFPSTESSPNLASTPDLNPWDL